MPSPPMDRILKTFLRGYGIICVTIAAVTWRSSTENQSCISPLINSGSISSGSISPSEWGVARARWSTTSGQKVSTSSGRAIKALQLCPGASVEPVYSDASSWVPGGPVCVDELPVSWFVRFSKCFLQSELRQIENDFA